MSNQEIKLVVWDLDHTIWDGILLEDAAVTLKPDMKHVIETLDKRGILHSIASKNDAELALCKLEEFGIAQYFLYPEIHWNSKSSSIKNIQKNVNIGFDAILFIDDQSFELDEVDFANLGVSCVHAEYYQELLSDKRLMPRFITEDSARRREMYMADVVRKHQESQYEGPSDQFLSALNMKFSIYAATELDLQRAEELTVRTNQLNSTGKTYSYEQLVKLLEDDQYRILVCELNDIYGTYGKIGIALIRISEPVWHVELLLMSCRVMSRGVGTVLLHYIMNQARQNRCTLEASFVETGKNRMMNISYRFAGFSVKWNDGRGNYVYEHALDQISPYPTYVELDAPTNLMIRSEEKAYGLS